MKPKRIQRKLKTKQVIKVEVFTDVYEPMEAWKQVHGGMDNLSARQLLAKILPDDLIDFKVAPDYSGRFIVTVIWRADE